VDARFLRATEVAGLRAEAEEAQAQGLDAVFFGDGPAGDPFVLAAGLSGAFSAGLLGVRVSVPGDPAGTIRHPAMLARETTALDLLRGGRTALSFTVPETDEDMAALLEAIMLCRALWRDGAAESDGPRFPVHGAVSRSRPTGGGAEGTGPVIALELTGDTAAAAPVRLVDAVDYVLRPSPATDVYVMERV
jgi:alkanesulfonate monooxygenase SsuD/methylene tetrahydromethanopterin reductase-like flavin-dependent oxidoreductase (luciferase family)